MLGEVHIGATRQIRLHDSCVAVKSNQMRFISGNMAHKKVID